MKFLAKKNSVNVDSEYLVLLFHPDGTSLKKNKMYINQILCSLKKVGIQVHCIYPCTDIGYEEITKQLEKISKINRLFRVYKNLDYDFFVNLVKNSKFLIGNSSSGIIESSYLNVPVINLGDRQKNRISSSNVINCKINIKQIDATIKYILSGKLKKKIKKTKLIYGNGESYLKNFKVIKNLVNKNQIIITKFLMNYKETVLYFTKVNLDKKNLDKLKENFNLIVLNSTNQIKKKKIPKKVLGIYCHQSFTFDRSILSYFERLDYLISSTTATTFIDKEYCKKKKNKNYFT